MVIVLVGFMGAGKTTVGQLLAKRLGVPFLDSDVVIEQRQGRSIKSIFETDGEAHFRELEHRTIAELVEGEGVVLALGGGALGDARTRDALKAARVVYLRVALADALARVKSDPRRPMLQRPDLPEIYAAREPVYAAAADITVDTHGLRPEAVAAAVAAQLQS